MTELGIWRVDELCELISDETTKSTEHHKNLRRAEVKKRDRFVSHEKAIVNTTGVSNQTEGIAYNLFKESISAYNTQGGKIIQDEMSEEQKQEIRNKKDQYFFTEDNASGNPDFICFDENGEIFLVEVKSENTSLTATQKKWINKNKWFETYLLRLTKEDELDFGQIISPNELQNCKFCSTDAKNLL